MTNGQWRGVIEEYRELLELPDGLEAVTLREGGTPLVHSAWLTGETGGKVWLKVTRVPDDDGHIRFSVDLTETK